MGWLLWLAIFALIPPSSAATLVTYHGSNWRFNDSANLDGVSWFDPAYDDEAWTVGPSTFYHDENPAVYGRRTPLAGGRTTYYFRHRFPGPGYRTNMVLALDLALDDGAVIYLNGREVQRIRLPAAPSAISYGTAATGVPNATTGGDATSLENLILSGNVLTNLVEGNNVMAVEVHQADAVGDDIAFGVSIQYRFTNSPPVFISQPTDRTVVEGSVLFLNPLVDGDPSPKVQWFREGAPLNGRVFANLSLAYIRLAEAGAFTLVASNSLGVVTSQVAQVTVIPDTIPPQLIQARGLKELTNVVLQFNEWINPNTALSLANFEVFRTSAPAQRLNILGATVTNVTQIVLTTEARVPGVNYSVRVSGVQDNALAGNSMPAPMTVPMQYEVELVSLGDDRRWRYFATGELPATNWFGAQYLDDAWPQGSALFHGGTPMPAAGLTPATSLPLTPIGSTNPIITYYFRTHFDLPGDMLPGSLEYRQVINDGVILYLNGLEFGRYNLFSSPPTTYETRAYFNSGSASLTPPPNQAPFRPNPAPAPLANNNLLAAEVHQHGQGYNDVTFGLQLTVVVTNFTTRPVLELPPTVVEGAGVLPAAGRVTLNQPLPTDLLVTLNSGSPELISLPSAVTLPAGATGVEFDVQVGDDTLVNGPRRVTVSVISGTSTNSAAVNVWDNETNSLALALPANLIEGQTGIVGTISFARAAVVPVAIQLASSLPADFKVPISVVMPAGASTVSFPVELVDNRWLDGDRAVTVSAAVPGWPGAALLRVLADNEARTLALQVTPSIIEGNQSTGRVWLGGLTISNLTVQLVSSDPARLTVPTELVISGGQSNAVFELVLPDDTVPEPAITVQIAASASGFVPTNQTVQLLDDDPDHFAFSFISSPQRTESPIWLTVRAEHADGTIQSNFNKTITLQASGMSGSLAVTPTNAGPFVGGVWWGTIQVLNPDRLVRLSTSRAPGESNPFNVEATAWRTLNLMAADLAWHEDSKTLFASVPSWGGTYSNRLVAIDPHLGAVTNAYEVGPDPGQIELSADGSFLYLSVSNRLAVRRFEVTNRLPGLTFAAGTNQLGPLSFIDFDVLAGAPDSIIATLSAPAGNAGGTWRFDSGTPSQIAQLPPLSNPYWVEAAPAGLVFYGYENNNQFPLLRGEAHPAGVFAVTNGLLNGPLFGNGTMVLRDGVLYSGHGRAVVADTFELVGDYPNVMESVSWAGLPEIDPQLNRLFYLTGRVQLGNGLYKIKVYERTSRLPLGELELPALAGGPIRFLRWSTNGLVFNTGGGQVWFIQSPTLQPTLLPVNLGLTQNTSVTPVVVGGDFTLTLSLTNAGPGIATFVQVSNAVPHGLRMTTLLPSSGVAGQTNGSLIWNIERLDPGQVATLAIGARFTRGGMINSTASVSAYEGDSDFNNNVSSIWHDVRLAPGVEGAFEVNLTPIADLAYDALRDRLLVAFLGQLAVFNPHTGVSEQGVGLGEHPTRLLRTADHQDIYIALRQSGAVIRLDRATLATTQQFALGTETIFGITYSFYADELIELPGHPDSLVISRRRIPAPTATDFGTGLAIYDNGVMRPSVAEYGGIWRLEANPNTGEVFGLNHEGDYYSSRFFLRRFAIDGDGITTAEAYPEIAGIVGKDIEFAGGNLVTSGGRRLAFTPFRAASLYPGSENAALVRAEPDGGRVWFLASDLAGGWHLNLHATTPTTLLGSVPVPGLRGEPRNLILWGTNGLAFHTTSNQLFVVRTALRQPASEADVQLSFEQPPVMPVPGLAAQLRITVTNSGPGPARGLALTNLVSSPLQIVSVGCSVGACSTNIMGTTWNLDQLAMGAGAEILVTVRAVTNGLATLRAEIATSTPDLHPADNAALGFLRIAGEGAPGRPIVLPVGVADVAWAPTLGRLLLSHTNSGPWHGALLQIEPVTLQASHGASLGPGANRIVVPDGATRVHAGVASSVHSLALPGLTPLRTFAIETNGVQRQLVDIAALPGAPDSLVLLRDGGTPRQLAVFDAGVQRPNATETAAGDLELSDAPAVVFATSEYFAGFERHSLGVDGASLMDRNYTWSPTGLPVELAWAKGPMFASSGEVFDPTTRILLGRVAGITNRSLVLFDSGTDRVFYLTTAAGQAEVRTVDAKLLIPLGTEVLGPLPASASRFIRWGTDGLAVRTTDGQVHLWRSSLLPNQPATDLRVTLLAQPSIGVVGSNLTFNVTITNTSSAAVAGTRLLVSWSAGIAASLTSVGAVEVVDDHSAILAVDAMAPFETRTMNFHVTPAQPGQLTTRVKATSTNPDADHQDNFASVTVPVALTLAPDQTVALAMPVRDLAWDPNAERLYVSGAADHIAIVDPATATLSGTWATQMPSDRLAITDDGQFLYTGLDGGRRVGRVRTSTGELDFNLPIDRAPSFGESVLTDLKPLPGQPGSFMVTLTAGSFFAGATVYDDATPRPNETGDNAGATFFTFGDQPSVAYILRTGDWFGRAFQTYELSPEGVTSRAPWNYQLPGDVGEFTFAGGLLYAASGHILRPETGALIERVPGISGDAAVRPDLMNGRLFFVSRANTQWELRAHDPVTLGLLGSQALTNIQGRPTRLVRWGGDGLAFCTSSNQLILLRSSLVPNGSPTDLIVSQRIGASSVSLGDPLTLITTVSNAGPATASQVVLLNALSTNAPLLGFQAVGGLTESSSGLLTARWPSVAPGATVELRATVVPDAGGWVISRATASAANLELHLPDNAATSVVPIRVPPEPNQATAIPVAVTDMEYDPISGLLFAALTNRPSGLTGDVVAINPGLGLIQDVFPVGADIVRLGITDDGTKLHALGEGGQALHRLRLAGRQVELTTRFTNSQAGPGMIATDLETVPGQPNSVAIVLQIPGGYGEAHVYRYDGDVEQPLRGNYAREIEFFNPTNLLSFEPNYSSSTTRRFDLLPEGLVERANADYLVNGRMEAAAGLIYTSAGRVIDPQTMTTVRELGFGGAAHAVDVAAGRAAFVRGHWNTTRLDIVDTLGLHLWSTLAITNALGEPVKLIRCGGDRLAFLTSSNQLFLIRSPMIGSGPASDLAVTLRLPPSSPAIDREFDVVLVVTNAGPATAASVRAIQFLPPNCRIVATTALGPTIQHNDGTMLWDLFNLPAGMAATNRVTLRAAQPGLFPLKTVLRSSAQDANPENDVGSALWTIVAPADSLPVRRFELPAADLVWEPMSQRLLVSLPSTVPLASNSVVAIDPTSGTFGRPFPVGPNPRRLAPTDDGQFLYVGLDGSAAIAKVRLADQAVVQTFPIEGGFRVRQLRAVPGRNDMVAALREYYSEDDSGTPAGLAVMRDSILLPTDSAHLVANLETIAMHPNGQRIFGYDAPWYGGLHLVDLSETEFHESTLISGLLSGYGVNLELADNRLISSSGVVLDPASLNIITNLAAPGIGAQLALDPAAGVLSFLVPAGNRWMVRQHAWSDFAVLREVRLPGVVGRPRNLQRWGTGNVAFTTSSNQLFIVQPALAAADIGVTSLSGPTEVIAHQPATIGFTVTNHAASLAPDILVTNTLLPAGEIRSVLAPVGVVHSLNGGQVVIELGDLLPHESRTIVLEVTAHSGSLTVTSNQVSVASAYPDPPAENYASLSFVVKPDNDWDGLPDEWEQANGLNPWNATDRNQDSDGDGLTNFGEFLAGTDPRNSTSVLRALVLDPSSTTPQFSFTSRPGRRYAIEWSPVVPAANWNVAVSEVVASANVTTVSLPGLPPQTSAFVRVRLLP